MSEDNNITIVELSKYAKEKQAKEELEVTVEFEESAEDFLEQGLETFIENLDGAKAFMSIIIDEAGNPEMIWAGEFDPVPIVGALEVAKQIFASRAYDG